MAYKFEIIGSALVVSDTVTLKVLVDTPKRDAYYNTIALTNEKKIELYDTNGVKFNGAILGDQYFLSQCQDGSGVIFTESSFRDFARTNLGYSDVTEGGSLSSYKIYSALVDDQVGTGVSNPVVTVLDNTIGNIVWVRSTTGLYFGTLSGAFPAGKTHLSITPSSPTGNYSIFRNTDSIIVIKTQDNGTMPFTDADGKLFNNSIEIKVYN